jgi:4-aminobutyrate aminotransferase-like enzyme/Ser/Thr protein kinase RdoA (MazF antagonist)
MSLPENDALFDFFARPELPTPTLGPAEARRLLAEVFGVTADLGPLGSQQDQNFLLFRPGTTEPFAVLKISNPAFSGGEIDLQTIAAGRVAEAWPQGRVASVRPGRSGPMDAWWETSEGRLRVRVLEFMEGTTFTGSQYLSPAVVARMGELAARVSRALEGLAHPAADRVLQWDLRHAERVIDLLAADDPDEQIRGQVLTAAAALDRVRAELPLQIGHFDLTDDNLMAPHGPVPLPDSIIDFGDVMRSWRVAELAVTIASVLDHDGATPLSVLPAVRAFHALRPLTAAEVDAIWPLVVLRGAVLVLSGRQQVRLDADNAYVANTLDEDQLLFDIAASVPVEVMSGVFREALGFPTHGFRAWSAEPIVKIAGPVQVIDPSTISGIFDEGAWQRTDVLQKEAERHLDAGAAAVIVPFGSTVLAGSPTYSVTAPETVTTGMILWTSEPLTLPDLPARIRVIGGRERLPIRIQAVENGHPFPPFMIQPGYRAGWRSVAIDPAPAFGLPTATASVHHSALARRERHLAGVQEHYYENPPQIERGWREHLIDTDGRVYLDMVNNVTSVGHSHPRVTEAATRQLRLLNTNSRFNYDVIGEYAERITETLPDSLDTVFFVNSGSEATDLAVRLAMASTGRTDIVAMLESYHGWTYASDAISTSVADNPNALATRPSWVHTVDAANVFRGRYRAEEGHRYAEDAVAKIRSLPEIAGFICESYFGTGGGIALPDGYLAAVYEAVRAAGGVVIADEVQVGYGRLGQWFWGFEQQGVVPDVVAVAKSAGSGLPIGVVITTKAIADRYRTQGYFFSSTGGSPLSCAVGLTVLDIIQTEQLQKNALEVGTRLADGLRQLAEKHALIGTVHGSGLYLGPEFVRDRETLEPATEETAAICERLLELGVVLQPTGDHQNVLKIKPPLCLSAESADFFLKALDRVLGTGY